MVVFENSEILVKKTGRDYDFIATIENKTDKEIVINFDNEEVEPIVVNDWIGILADSNGRETLDELTNGKFTISPY